MLLPPFQPPFPPYGVATKGRGEARRRSPSGGGGGSDAPYRRWTNRDARRRCRAVQWPLAGQPHRCRRWGVDSPSGGVCRGEGADAYGGGALRGTQYRRWGCDGGGGWRHRHRCCWVQESSPPFRVGCHSTIRSITPAHPHPPHPPFHSLRSPLPVPTWPLLAPLGCFDPHPPPPPARLRQPRCRYFFPVYPQRVPP